MYFTCILTYSARTMCSYDKNDLNNILKRMQPHKIVIVRHCESLRVTARAM